MSLEGREFNFVYGGHNYTLSDSARDQGICPHCMARCSNKTYWNVKDDEESYIGTYHFGDYRCAICFECPDCFKKFFYHDNDEGVSQEVGK